MYAHHNSCHNNQANLSGLKKQQQSTTSVPNLDYIKLESLQQQSTQSLQAHICTRNCVFQHQFGNVFSCFSSGTTHVCDITCNQKVWYDNYHSICRLSKRLFRHAEPPLTLERWVFGEYFLTGECHQ